MQIHHSGRWHDAALEIQRPEQGIMSPCAIDYDLAYFAAIDMADGKEVIDWQALSVSVLDRVAALRGCAMRSLLIQGVLILSRLAFAAAPAAFFACPPVWAMVLLL